MADRRFHWEYQELPVERQAFRVTGGRPLRGRVQISGSKNAALKMLAAATLTGERCKFTNVPEIEDVRVMVEVLRDLGVVVDHPAPNTYEVAAGDVEWLFVPLEAAAKMRASFILLGPLLSRFGRVIMSNPGGDRIGRRPVNLHVDAMRAMGADIEYRNGYYFARTPGRLRGADISFPTVTVMGTENAMLAAALAEGRTVIRPAAQEPEVDDLILLLQQMGAQVERTQPDTIVVEGQRRLRGAEHRIMPDRIEAGTFVVAAAVTGGDMTIESAPCDHLGAFLDVVADIGVPIACGKDTIEVHCDGAARGTFSARDISTAPYPGLATDLQSPISVLLTQANGTSKLHETIFEDRLEWLSELRRLGAKVELHDEQHASIHGPAQLRGAEVEMGDLRAGASLILAALTAEGTSVIHGAHHVRRGYENIEGKFLDLGAQIERVSEGAGGSN
ncbi:UDP-N-acetylglucosamine 1-carboxyvinyltransferase [soil metagenome]